MDLDHVVEFFWARKKESGGFGQSVRLPATIEDTYYALRTLILMKDKGFKVPRKLFLDHELFLMSKLREKSLGPRSMFQLKWCMEALGIPNCVPSCVKPRRGHLDIEPCFYLNRMGAFSHRGVGFLKAKVKTVRDLRMYFSLLGSRLGPAQKGRWMSWLRSCQNPDGGLGFMPGTTSFVENCYYGIRILEMIGVFDIIDLDSLRRFVFASKSGRGGFGRNSLGVPLPSSTWHAVGTLLLFNGPRKG